MQKLKHSPLLPLLLALTLPACNEATAPTEPKVTKIAFGSCQNPFESMEVIEHAIASGPDMFIYLGDNVYADTEDPAEMRASYQELADQLEFQRLLTSTTVVATWDDHDYGVNDGGNDYPMRQTSQEIFLDFWQEPADSERRDTPGIYTSYMLDIEDRTVQVILPDTRYFRDPPMRNDGSIDDTFEYMPATDPTLTVLGETQWTWLAEQFDVPADVRIIGSSIQFSHQANGYESWTNFPEEQQRFLDLIKEKKANGVLFVSGDVHWGEISSLPNSGGYDIIDVTSSGINQEWPLISANNNRIGEAVADNNFGLIEIDWSLDDPQITLSLTNRDNEREQELTLLLSDLQF